MNKPQDYYGILQDEEFFSDELDYLFELTVEKFNHEQRGQLRDLVYMAYKEGYIDATKKILFMIKK